MSHNPSAVAAQREGGDRVSETSHRFGTTDRHTRSGRRQSIRRHTRPERTCRTDLRDDAAVPRSRALNVMVTN